ncbi:hypothetical protein HRbin17_01058 [bacterium HR17]|uniref:Uncharacterized protein n=1 Tax=Candidatus Fervidibacter japonicus TaxID=2035412 RepID=A0A2H5XBJ7_9BACT|nr:hypothetical protein HRbin17_01058 [bacterium HR17]
MTPPNPSAASLPAGSPASGSKWAIALGVAIVIATGVIAAHGRVSFPSLLSTRLEAVSVQFYDVQTGQPVEDGLLRLWRLAQEQRLAYFVSVMRLPPRYGWGVMQSVLGWLCLWFAAGLVGLLLRCPLSLAAWWQLGAWIAVLALWRLVQAIAVSAWLWLPAGRPDLINALVDIALGAPPSFAKTAAVLLRGSLWLLAPVAHVLCLFVVLRKKWQCRLAKAVSGTMLTVLLAQGAYALAMRAW